MLTVLVLGRRAVFAIWTLCMYCVLPFSMTSRNESISSDAYYVELGANANPLPPDLHSIISLIGLVDFSSPACLGVCSSASANSLWLVALHTKRRLHLISVRHGRRHVLVHRHCGPEKAGRHEGILKDRWYVRLRLDVANSASLRISLQYLLCLEAYVVDMLSFIAKALD